MREIKKILFVTCTNIGDVLMTLPALDLLRGAYPAAEVTVLAGPRIAGLFEGNSAVSSFISFDKYAPLGEKLKLFRRLRAMDFDLCADMRDSLFGYLLGRVRMPLVPARPRGTHSWERHRSRVRSLVPDGACAAPKGSSIAFSREDREFVERLLGESGAGQGRKPVVISPGARSTTKCWSKDKYLALAKALTQRGIPVLLVGDKGNSVITGYICGAVPAAVDIAGKTSLLQMACLLTRSAVLVANDSGIMHLASYLDVPIAAVMGPSDDIRYGPWSRASVTVKKELECRPCMAAQCRFGTVRCLDSVQVEDVCSAIERFLV